MDTRGQYPCPCCGHLTMGEPPGSFDICPVCFWEDDAIQLRWPDYAGGANGPSLVDAQQSFIGRGAVEGRLRRSVRKARDDEPVDEGWRVIDLAVDPFEARGVKEAEWPEDLTTLYWWRPTFWRQASGH